MTEIVDDYDYNLRMARRRCADFPTGAVLKERLKRAEKQVPPAQNEVEEAKAKSAEAKTALDDARAVFEMAEKVFKEKRTAHELAENAANRAVTDYHKAIREVSQCEIDVEQHTSKMEADALHYERLLNALEEGRDPATVVAPGPEIVSLREDQRKRRDSIEQYEGVEA